MLLALVNFHMAVPEHHGTHINKCNAKEEFSRKQRKAEAIGGWLSWPQRSNCLTCLETERIKELGNIYSTEMIDGPWHLINISVQHFPSHKVRVPGSILPPAPATFNASILYCEVVWSGCSTGWRR